MEVAQTAQGVGTALGYDAWYVQGSSVQVITPTLAAKHPTPVLEPRLDTGDSYAGPAFGFQAGA